MVIYFFISSEAAKQIKMSSASESLKCLLEELCIRKLKMFVGGVKFKLKGKIVELPVFTSFFFFFFFFNLSFTQLNLEKHEIV